MLTFLVVILAVLAYTWVGYPSIVLVLGRRAARLAASRGANGTETIAGQGAFPGACASDGFPPVAILFSAHNEERVIGQRLENLDELEYPADRLTVLVGVDGGNDRTAEAALAWASTHAAVRVVVSRENHGKMTMLKRLAAQAEAPVLVFSDANTMFARDAVKRLVSPLADSRVGGVCGRLEFVERPSAVPLPGMGPDRPTAEGTTVADETDERTYWDLETRMKMAEASIDSCLGANGAIYAIRRSLFPCDVQDNTIVDDFVIGMKVREQGFRMVYEPAALAREEVPGTIENEWRRRVRIGAGVYQALSICRRCLLPRYGVFAWMFWSHKVLRWFTPHLGVAALALALWLVVNGTGGGTLRESGRIMACCAVGGALLAGVAGRLLKHSTARWTGLFRLWNYFLTMQAALFAGFLRFCRGNLKGTWARTERR
jgi:cellulose synthase/poly-beta-1,6-N-acetylglucosamine synthase-like glycosyltransferase